MRYTLEFASEVSDTGVFKPPDYNSAQNRPEAAGFNPNNINCIYSRD